MGKLVWQENGRTFVRNFAEIVQVFENGRRGEPVKFTGVLHLTSGSTGRTLQVFQPMGYVCVGQSDVWSRWLICMAFGLVGFLIHRLYVLLN